MTIPIIPAPRHVIIDMNNKLIIDSIKIEMNFPNQQVQDQILSHVRKVIHLITGTANQPNAQLIQLTTGNTCVSVNVRFRHEFLPSQYLIIISENILMEGGSNQALNWATVSLLQLLEFDEQLLKWVLPKGEINDSPSFPYMGLMIDLARKWHPLSVLKQCIRLCWWYKIPFLQLHFCDNESFTFPLQCFPKMGTRKRHYATEEIKELAAYAQEFGITIVPEIDLPGHAKAIVNAYPKIFGLKPYKWGKPKFNVINIGKEEVYIALEQIFEEILSYFPKAPFFHIGADEVRYESMKDDPMIKEYCTTHNLPDVHELYRHFIVRMNELIKKIGQKRGRALKMCVWEGFKKEGLVQIPKEIPVFVFESQYNPADSLVADGFKVVNTSWTPIYITPWKHWTPEEIYRWNPLRWQNWSKHSLAHDHPIDLPDASSLLGAQMCSWEQKAEMEIPSLRLRLPAFIDRVWNLQNSRKWEEFEPILKTKNEMIEKIVFQDL